MSEVGRSRLAASEVSVGVPDAADVTPIVRPLKVEERSRATTDEFIASAVKVARDAGMSWVEIGDIFGISGQTTSERYAARIGETSPVEPAAESHDKAS